MSSEERVMLNFLFLAAKSHEKKQMPGRDRFLIVTLVTACKAGFPSLADQCRELIVKSSPHHLLSHYTDAATAMRADDFQVFIKQLQRFCTPERAEHLAIGLEFQAEEKLKQHNHDLQKVIDDLWARISF